MGRISGFETVKRTSETFKTVGLYALLCLVGGSACRGAGSPTSETPRNRLVATIRGEPRSFNRLAFSRFTENVIAMLTQATLVRVNRKTGILEPRLAKEWSSA